MRHRIATFFFVIAMVVMAVVLTIAAVLICTVRVLHPQRLTPIVCAYANSVLDADVKISRVELSFAPSFPELRLEVDSLVLVSKAFDGLSAEERAALPQWSDSLFSLDRFSGSVNLGKFLTKGEIAVRDVELYGPAVNIVISEGGKGNFDIYQSTDTVAADDSGPVAIPPFSINRFAYVDAREIRYFNAVDNTSATVLMVRDITLDGKDNPSYALHVDGHLSSPLTKDAINLEDISFGLDGRVRWEPTLPSLLTLEQFSVSGAFLKARLDTSLDFDSMLVVKTANLTLDPVNISDALTVLPDSLRRANRLVAPYFRTDASIGVEAALTAPFVVGVDSIPSGTVTLTMPDSYVRYGQADIRQLGFDITATLEGGSLEKAAVDIRRFEIAGPATHIKVSGRIADFLGDPVFETNVQGDIELKDLPPIVADYAGGFISGRLDASLDAKGKMSMLSAENFHKLNLRGRLEGQKLYYLSNDTATMAEVGRAVFVFGSKVENKADSTAEAPMLAAAIKVDTANVLVDGVSIALANLGLGVGVENSGLQEDTTLVVPVGGGISLGRLRVISVSDSAGMTLRDMSGKVALRRYKNYKRIPEIEARLDVRRMAAGTKDSRLMLSQAHIDATTHKIPMQRTAFGAVRKLADSLSRVHPDLSPDSVYKLAIAKRRRNIGERRRPRVHGELTSEELEIIDWGLSSGFKKFLLGWELKGTLKTRNARVFTPMFPLRNSISRLDVAFSNDSVAFKNVQYTAGRTDLAIRGLISNIKKGLTSTQPGNSLKINFDVASDTIDVNQLAAAAFAGAAYMERLRTGGTAAQLFEEDESALDDRMKAIASEQPDTVGALLVPTNVDATLRMKASNIMYSDLEMTDMTGDMLIYDGGVNLHRFRANSDAGDLNFTALYSAPKADDIHIGFSLDLERFNIERFLKLVPAVDSIMPLMRDFSGIIDAELAATADIDSNMNVVLPSLDAAVRLTGDSLAFIDHETYATLGKWLRFRDKADNTIKHMNVEMIVRDDRLQIFPFTFDIDRYRLGIVGYNDLDLNFDYHIAVLKSPIPFKFGITLEGNPDKYKVRFGGAKFKEGEVAQSVNVVDTARVNLLQQIEGVFRRGVRNSRFARMNIKAPDVRRRLTETDPGLSAADSLTLIREGLIEAPEETVEKNGK